MSTIELEEQQRRASQKQEYIDSEIGPQLSSLYWESFRKDAMSRAENGLQSNNGFAWRILSAVMYLIIFWECLFCSLIYQMSCWTSWWRFRPTIIKVQKRAPLKRWKASSDRELVHPSKMSTLRQYEIMMHHCYKIGLGKRKEIIFWFDI